MNAIGGYVPRGDRWHPPEKDDGALRCGFCRTRLDFITPWNQPHICKELTFGTAITPRFEDLDERG